MNVLYRYPTHIILSLVTLSLLFGLFVKSVNSTSQSPQTQITTAWQTAQRQGAFDYRSTLEQTSYPLPKLTNAGRSAQQTYVGIAGSVDNAKRELALTLWPDWSFDPNTGSALRVEGDRVFERDGDGAWQLVDTDVTAFAPAGDPLAWLSAAENVQNGDEPNLFTFDIDGAAFAEHVRSQMQTFKQERGALPAGMRLEAPAIYQQMSGQGELRLSETGLPETLTLEILLPASADQGRITAEITTTFSGFAAPTALPLSFDSAQQWLIQQQATLVTLARTLLVVSLTLFFALLIFNYGHSSAFYRLFSVAIIGSMLASPLLQPLAYRAHAAEQPAVPDEPTVAQEVAQTMATAREFNPNRSPLNTAAPQQVAPPLTRTSTLDSDGDGLTDADEADWMTCAYIGAPDHCDNVVDPTDTDGDGLKDGIEVHRLTTDPVLPDSDHDGIADKLEVEGFSYQNQQWYFNPNESDSNKDGLLDGQECPAWITGSAEFNANAICPDTDGDGTPNAWDDDNDGDGVIDAVDSAPDTVSATIYDRDNPMSLQIDGLTTDEPVFVDLQLRPEENEHLYYVGNVLDWPSNDTQGQIQRRLDTTFATTTSELLSTDPLAANGDVRLTPLLEIYIPYTDGHYSNLPVKTAYQGTPRTLEMLVSDWLDVDKLEPFGITVRDAADGSGDLYAYLPLGTVADDTGGARVALAARMVYWPSSADWSTPHQYRVNWMVQRLQDVCVSGGDDPDTCTLEDELGVIHVYDEQWTATGLTVREDRGMSLGILYEDPAQDGDLTQNQDLWPASLNLNNTFVAGRDCDSFDGTTCSSNGERDVTVANMESRLDEWSSNSDALEARTFTYDHHALIAHVNMTETVALLSDVFEPASVETPTLLFARETTARTNTLADVTDLSGTLAFDLSGAAEVISADLSWTTYEQVGGDWQAMSAARALDLMRLQLEQLPDFQAEVVGEDEANGRLLWAEMYFAGLLSGITAVVAIDGAVIWEQSQGAFDEENFEPAWPTATFAGATYVFFVFLEMFKQVVNPDASWGAVWSEFSTPYFTHGLLTRFPRLQTAASVMMGVTALTAIAGFALFTYAFFADKEGLQETAEIILNAVTVVTASVALANYITLIALASQAGNSVTAVTAANKVLGPAGMVLQFVVIWGGFIFFGLTNGIFNDTSSIAFNMTLAFAVAQTIVLLIIIGISYIPIAGQIFVLLIYLSDAIASFFGEQGAQGHAVTFIAELIYDVDMIIQNLDSPNRLDFRFVEMHIAEEELGYTTEQNLTYTVAVTNTLRYKNEQGPTKAKRSTFYYYLQQSPTDRLENLKLGQQNDDWKGVKGNKIQITAAPTLTETLPLANIGSGINRNLGGNLYLSESYAVPYVGCWTLPVHGTAISNVDCETYTITGTMHIDIGQYSVFDILPSTLTGFYNMLAQTGDQIDPDGDGLTSANDVGNLTWDSDGDTLNDYFEIANGTNPIKADSDDDGILDADELRRGLNPNNADPDGDMLSDSAEWDGWIVAYDDGKVTRVWSNPNAPDYDEDRLTDREEFIYALHPLVASNDDQILETIQFSGGTVREADSARTRLRFDEPAGALSFVDVSDSGNAGCRAIASCPTAGAEGRYGRALAFDGVDDFVDVPFVLNPATTEFTAAAWINRSQPNATRAIIGQGSSLWLYVSTSGRLGSNLGGTDTLGSAQLGFDQWHHVAAVYDGSQLTLYLDGVQYASRAVTMGANDADLVIGARDEGAIGDPFFGRIDDVTILDRAVSEAELADVMAGRIDVDDRIVAPGSAVAMQMTISNTNPVYSADVVNYAGGDVSLTSVYTHTPYAYFNFDEPSGTTFAAQYHSGTAICDTTQSSCPTAGATGYSGNGVTFDRNASLRLDSILSGYSATDGYSLGFWIKPNAPANANRNIVHWVQLYKDGSDVPINQVRQALPGTLINGAVDYGVTAGNAVGPAAPIGEWTHVGLSVDTKSNIQHLYVNGVYADSANSFSANTGALNNGELHLGCCSNHQLDENFSGVLDEFVFYNRSLSPDEMTGLYNGSQIVQSQVVENVPQLLEVGSQSTELLDVSATIAADRETGSFVYRQLAEASLRIPNTALNVDYDPVLRFHFDERRLNPNYGSAALRIHEHYSRLQNHVYAISCLATDTSSQNCPQIVRDFAGGAGLFNGTNNGMSHDASGLATEAWTVGIWVHPTHGDSSERAILGDDGGKPTIYIDGSDQLVLTHKENDVWQAGYTAGGTVPRNAWSHVVATHNGSGGYQLYLNGQPVGADVSLNEPAGIVGMGGFIGRADFSPYAHFEGMLDNFTVYDVELDAANVAALYSQTDLSLHMHIPFDDAPGSSTLSELTGLFGDPTCNIGGGQCPLLGIRSISNRGAYFDGDLLQSTLPGHWTNDLIDRGGITFAGWMRVGEGQEKVLEARSAKPAFLATTNSFGGWSNDTPNGLPWHMPAYEWTHVIFSFAASNSLQGVWINGEEMIDRTTMLYDDGSGSQSLNIGSLELTGFLDDIRLYDRGFTNDEAVALYENTMPQLQFEFEEAAGATAFEDLSSNSGSGEPTNAIGGLAGRVGNGVTLHGDGFVQISGTQALDTLTDSFTLMAWIYPDGVSDKQWIIAPERTNSNDGFGLGIESGTLFFETFGGETFASSASVFAGQWQHVTLVFDAQHQARFFIDGVLQDTVAGAQSATANADDTWLIGATTGSGSSTSINHFDGAIDEVLVYQRVLASAEIDSAYINQFRWFRKQVDVYLNVDADDPTITLQTTQDYWPNSYIQLAVTTEDVGSSIHTFEFGVQGSGDATMRWQAAAPCQDVSFGKVWCPSFTPSGEGAYSVQFRAVDAVGNETLSAVHTILVDETPPTATVDTHAGLLDIAQDEQTWLLPLSGTATDPQVGGVAGSGIYTPSLLVTLYDGGGNIIGQPQTATLIGDSWQLQYEIPGYRPQGVYSVGVTVADNAGNMQSEIVVSDVVFLDERSPSADVSQDLSAQYVVSDTLLLNGVAGELGQWSGAEVRLHFEQPDPFADLSAYGNDATCSNCPTANAGLFGDAAAFDGVDDTLQLTNLISETFSISLWFNAADSGVLVQQDDALLFIDANNRLTSALGGLNAPVILNTWHHAGLTFDGATVALYLDGVQVGSADVGGISVDNNLHIGSDGTGNDFFNGLIDELLIYERVLLPTEIASLAETNASGVNGVELHVSAVDFSAGGARAAVNSTTIPATLDNPDALFTTWEATLDPSTLEGFYEIALSGGDVAGNQDDEDVIWRGLIDGKQPIVSGGVAHYGTGSAAYTEYIVSASDFMLDLGASALPCSADTFNLTRYDDDTLPHDGQVNQLSAICRQPGHQPAQSVTVCDAAANCISWTPPLADLTSNIAVAILTPTQNTKLFGEQISVPIIVGAHDTNRIQSVAVSIDGQPFDEITVGSPFGGPTDVMLDFGNWEPTVSGSYALSAEMTDVFGSTTTDTIEVYIGLHDCLTELDGDGITDFYSDDMQALQDAVNLAAPGSTVRVSGDCHGTSSRDNRPQLLYLDKSLTIDGGYQGSAWETPTATLTTLDAQSSGRVVVITDTATVTLTNLLITNGNAGGNSRKGSGIFNTATVILDGVQIDNNSSPSGGGGLYNTGTMEMRNSTVMGNFSGGSGSGLFNDGGMVDVVNSTFSGNVTRWSGSAIHNIGGGIMTVTHSTIVSNTSRYLNTTTGVGAIYNGSTLTLRSSIVAHNDVGGDFAHAQADCRVIADGGYNVVGDGTGCATGSGTTVVSSASPLVAPLANNGSTTSTHLPLHGILLNRIPAGENDCGTTITTDQRWAARPEGGACDVGAVEDGSAVPTVVELGVVSADGASFGLQRILLLMVLAVLVSLLLVLRCYLTRSTKISYLKIK